MRVLLWLLRLGLFFLLFALALNNQHEAALKSLFGHEWRAPMVFIVLAAFLCGCAMGVFGMLPAWWRQRRTAPRSTASVPSLGAAFADAAGPVDPADPMHSAEAADLALSSQAGHGIPLAHPPRDGI